MKVLEGRWTPPDGSAPLPAIELVYAGTELVVLPARGGKIVSIRRAPAGPEWLWLNPSLRWRAPEAGARYVEQHDLGGWDECFPTIAPARLAGREWGDHGDIWWREWAVERRGEALWMGTEGPGYRFSRQIEPAGGGFRFIYVLESVADEPFDYLWSAHPLFRLEPPLNIDLIGRPRVRLGGESRLGRVGAEFRWPEIEGRPFHHVGKPSGLAVKLFVEVEEGEVCLTRPDGESLRLAWSRRALPFLGLWVNEGGWSGSGGPPYVNLGVEPATGAPDSLLAARDEWKTARSIAPGERHRWSLHLSVSGVE